MRSPSSLSQVACTSPLRRPWLIFDGRRGGMRPDTARTFRSRRFRRGLGGTWLTELNSLNCALSKGWARGLKSVRTAPLSFPREDTAFCLWPAQSGWKSISKSSNCAPGRGIDWCCRRTSVLAVMAAPLPATLSPGPFDPACITPAGTIMRRCRGACRYMGTSSSMVSLRCRTIRRPTAAFVCR